jgi:hypothetical protein
MFAVCFTPNSYITSVPSWWTQLWQNTYDGTFGFWSLYYKLASSEWANYTWWFTTWQCASILIITYRWWFDSTDPIDVVSNTQYITYNTTNRAATMSVTNINSPLVFFWWYQNSFRPTQTKPSVPTTWWAENLDMWWNLYNSWFEICSMVWASSWATWNMDSTLDWDIGVKHAFAVALNPESTWNPWAFFALF